MKYNYPIMYSAMPVNELFGWSFDDGKNCKIKGYVVSKCYVLSSSCKYKSNGTVEKKYEVVFPYQTYAYNKWHRVEPYFISGRTLCVNKTNVEEVFDTFEEASKYVAQKNVKLYKSTWDYVPYCEDYYKIVTTPNNYNGIQDDGTIFDGRSEKLNMLENFIEENTRDMQASDCKVLNSKTIKIEGNTGNVAAYTIYQAIEYYKNHDFLIFNVNDNHFNYLSDLTYKKELINMGLLDSETVLRYEPKSKDSLLKYGDYQAYMNDKTIIFVTTEPLEEIVKSIKDEYPSFDLNKPEGYSRKRINNN